MNSLIDLSRFITAERLTLRAGCSGVWWVHLEQRGWTMARGSGETLLAALNSAVDAYLRGVRTKRELA